MVYDWDTGKFKRGWGAYGKALSEIGNDGQPNVGKEGEPGAKDFKSPVHCVKISKDNLVYVCEPLGQPHPGLHQGRQVPQRVLHGPQHVDARTAGSVDFSPDPGQKYIFVADIMNMTVWELDRQTGRWCSASAAPGTRAAPSVSSMSRRWIRRAISIPAKSPMAAGCRNSRR